MIRRGEELTQSKLTEEDIRMIRELVKYREKLKKEVAGLSNKALAEKFDVHQRTMDKAVRYETWRHVK